MIGERERTELTGRVYLVRMGPVVVANSSASRARPKKYDEAKDRRYRDGHCHSDLWAFMKVPAAHFVGEAA